MHTTRNRTASRQPASKHHKPPPAVRAARQETDFMLRTAGTPPAFPRELILPDPQLTHSASTGVSVPTLPATSMPAAAPQTARRPKGKKARKAAMRMAAEQARKAASPKTLFTETGTTSPGPASIATLPATPQPAARFSPPADLHDPADCEIEAAAGRADANVAPENRAETALSAPTFPTTSQTILQATIPQTLPKTPPPDELATEPAPESAPAFLLPSAPEPLVTAPPPVAAALPLPRSRSLVPARRQGLVDVIAFLLRDSGRRLARWSSRRQKMREQYAQIYASDLRKAAMQSQLEALEALRQQQQR
jgi:hypothetical protein